MHHHLTAHMPLALMHCSEAQCAPRHPMATGTLPCTTPSPPRTRPTSPCRTTQLRRGEPRWGGGVNSCVLMRVCVCVCTHVCVCTRVCARLYVCLCLYVRVRVCVSSPDGLGSLWACRQACVLKRVCPPLPLAPGVRPRVQRRGNWGRQPAHLQVRIPDTALG